MSLLHGRIVLITDSGDPLGLAAAYATSSAGAHLVVNDPVGAGTMRAAAEQMVYSIKRRGGTAIAATNDPTRFRECISMIQRGFDQWDWISGIVHVDRDNGTSLNNILRAASHPMKQWGGTMVVLNASDEAINLVQSQAETLRQGRLLVNCVRPTNTLPESLVVFLMSPESIRAGVFGKVIAPAHNLSTQEVEAQIHQLAADKTPTKPEPTKPEPTKPEPAAKKPAAKKPDAKKPAAKKPAAKKPAAKKPAAKKPAAKKPAAKKPAAKKPAAKKPAAKKSSAKKASTKKSSSKKK